MLKNGDLENLLQEASASYQEGLKSAYEVGKRLCLIKHHESRETFVDILGRFGLTEIEGEAIVKAMRGKGEAEAAANIGEILIKAAIRHLEAANE